MLLKIKLLILCFSGFIFVRGQNQVLVYGNSEKICFLDGNTFQNHSLENFPESLDSFSVILIFSGANSRLSTKHLDLISSFLQSGKGVYIGCENWPLQAESNQLTNYFFQKEFWGNDLTQMAECTKNDVSLFESQQIVAGESTVHFPLDSRLKVEAWVNDEPLIMSTEFFGGNLILDGGYSRFYCGQKKEIDSVWNSMMNYLIGKTSD